MKTSYYRYLATQYEFPDEYKRFYLFHIRKTGGTSLNHMFLSLGDQENTALYDRLSCTSEHRIVSGNKVFVGWDKKIIEEGNYFYAFSHIPFHLLNLPKDTFTITCLRNPVDRVISHYKMLLHYRKNNIQHPCMLTEGEWLGNGFEDFLERIPKKHLLNQLYMFSSSYNIEEAYQNIISSSFYFFTEEFQKGILNLSEKSNYALEIQHVRKHENVVNIEDKLMKLLEQFLAPEFILYEKLQLEWKKKYENKF